LDGEDEKETAMWEPSAPLPDMPAPIDPKRLKQAMELVTALDGIQGLLSETGPGRVARAYDILTGAKP
jgi:hypothetical protein